MPENEDKTVGRPFDPEAARKAQAKAVEARKRNAEKKAELDRNPNGPTIESINEKCDAIVAHIEKINQTSEGIVYLLKKIIDTADRVHPKVSEIL